MSTLGSPKNAEEAAYVLNVAEEYLLMSEGIPDHLESYVHQLVRFLGANSGAWTVANRERLHSILYRCAICYPQVVVSFIVENVIDHPRTDIIDESVILLNEMILGII